MNKSLIGYHGTNTADIDRILENNFKQSVGDAEWLDMRVFFNTSDKINQKFKDSKFIIINAPAIAFPFMRSFVATVTLNAGYSPAILPSVNFLELKKRAIQ